VNVSSDRTASSRRPAVVLHWVQNWVQISPPQLKCKEAGSCWTCCYLSGGDGVLFAPVNFYICYLRGPTGWCMPMEAWKKLLCSLPCSTKA